MIRTLALPRVNAIDFLLQVSNDGRGNYTPKQVKKLFDDIISDIVRASNDWRCRKCGAKFTPPTTVLHHAHIIERGNKTTCWLFNNGISLCTLHHSWFDEIKHKRTRLILDGNYSEPQMQFLLDIGYDRQDLVRLALKSQDNWDHDYSLVALHLLEYVRVL